MKAPTDSKIQNLLFVCSLNKFRSCVAEKLCQPLSKYDARSRGTEPSARVRLSNEDILWADQIFAMEQRHASLIELRYAESLGATEIIILDIVNLYQPMEFELEEELKTKLKPYLDLES